jgi:23S rRNA (adenine2030-N6)-methyltransferase
VNYRHQFHAGNFADVFKHTVLVRLARCLQRKPAGLLLLDTHAGRGGYDLAAAALGDTCTRTPEWPDGIGRLKSRPDLPAEVQEYLNLVHQYESTRGHFEVTPKFYPGSPWLLHALARPQDRLALCELQPDEHAALRAELIHVRRATIQLLDGYTALRAMLPPPERRALVLIDPPFESQVEFARIAQGLDEGVRRLPGGTFAVWYPLTERARIEEFFEALRPLHLPPTLTVELTVNPASPNLRGCGLVIVNPPWQFEGELERVVGWLAKALAQTPGGGADLRWLVPET